MRRAWAFAQMGLARRGLARVPGIEFWKLCGSGTGEGFTPLPNTAVYAILAAWPDAELAREQTQNSRPFARYAAKAVESWHLYLVPTRVRGAWSGQTPFTAAIDTRQGTDQGPVAALTRATVRPRKSAQFWKRVPQISAMIGRDPNVLFKIGIGEVPLLHQVTFSIWPNADSMAAFARASGPHARAISAVRAGDWFSEELYARFRVQGSCGSWGGGDPLTARKDAA